MKKKLTPDFIFDSVAVANPAATSMKLDKPYGTPAGVAMTLPVSEIDFFFFFLRFITVANIVGKDAQQIVSDNE